jgi:hypothetical protein
MRLGHALRSDRCILTKLFIRHTFVASHSAREAMVGGTSEGGGLHESEGDQLVNSPSSTFFPPFHDVLQ